MYICICKNVTDGQIRKAVRERGVSNMRGLRRELGACDQCGKCAPEAQALIRQCLGEAPAYPAGPGLEAAVSCASAAG